MEILAALEGITADEFRVRYSKEHVQNVIEERFPVIDVIETGRNIRKLRLAQGLLVTDLQRYFNFELPRTIYQWESGRALPSVDNLYALSKFLRRKLDDIIVEKS